MNNSEKLRIRALYALLILSPLPFVVSIDRPNTFGISGTAWLSTAQYLASVFGYIGITLLVWQLILGTRSISGLFFDNLARNLKLHRTLGKYGVLLIFLHPLLILVNYGQSFTYLFQPSLATEFEEHVTFGRLALYALVILWVSSAFLRAKIGFRPWKYIHYIAYPTLLSALLHVPEVGHSYRDSVIRSYWTGIVVVVICCWVLRARHLFGIGKHRYKVTAKARASEQVWTMTLTPLQKRLEARKAHHGQYIYVQRSLTSEEHPFSIVSNDQSSGAITIAFKEFGKFTRKLAKLRVGDQLLIDGPYGVFTREIALDQQSQAVFIAGGIGITPFVQHIKSRPATLTTVFYAAKTAREAAYLQQIEKQIGRKLIKVFSDEPNQSNSAKIQEKRVSEALLKKHLTKEQVRSAQFFICGPPLFMQSVQAQLTRLGVAEERIHIEDFSF